MNPYFSHQLKERTQIPVLFREHNVPYTIHTVVVRKIKQGGVYLRINAYREYYFATESLYFDFVLQIIKERRHQFSTTKKFIDGVGVVLEIFKVAEQKEIGFAKRYRDLKLDCRYIAKTKVGRSQREVITYFGMFGSHHSHWTFVEYYRVTGLDKDFDGMLRGTRDAIFARVKNGIARFEYGTFADIHSMNSQVKFTKIAETKFRNVVGHRGNAIWVVGYTTDRKYEDLFNPTNADIDDVINATEVEIQLSPEFVQYVAENYDGQSIDPEFDQRLNIIGKPMHELLDLVEKCTGKCLNVKSKSVT